MSDADHLRAQQLRKRQQQQNNLLTVGVEVRQSVSRVDFKPLPLPLQGSEVAEFKHDEVYETQRAESSNSQQFFESDKDNASAAPAMMQLLHDAFVDDGVDEKERRRRNRPRRDSSSADEEARRTARVNVSRTSNVAETEDVEAVVLNDRKASHGRHGSRAWNSEPPSTPADEAENGRDRHSSEAVDDAEAAVNDSSDKKKTRNKKSKRSNRDAEDDSDDEDAGNKLSRNAFDSTADLYAELNLDLANLHAFVIQPAPKNVTMCCRILRDKKGIERHSHPVYYMHLEHGPTKRTFLLAGRRRVKVRTNTYAIFVDPIELSRNTSSHVGKVRANFLGTQFTVSYAASSSTNQLVNGQELAAVLYDTNIMGLKGPRKMTVVVPGMNEDGNRVEISPGDSLVDRFKRKQLDGLLDLHNKSPVWNEETHSYMLNFHGRVTQASVKNFQIVHNDDLEYIILQFGRVSSDVFTLDYKYPLSALQAFGIAISSFDNKLACE